MRFPDSPKFALLVSISIAIVSGCSVSSLSGSVQPPVNPMMRFDRPTARHITAASDGLATQHKNLRSSEMFNIKRGAKLLYISDQEANVVQVYNYPSNGTQNPPAGTLTGFDSPEGECVDASRHHVFITNNQTAQIFEFAYGATSPTRVISDAGHYPSGCAVDPTTRNLAVTNGFSGSAQGSVSVYARPYTGSPTVYTDPGFFEVVGFASYDMSGNLFVDGATYPSFTSGLAELPAKASAFRNLSISNFIGYPGGVNYDAQRGYIVINDNEAPYAYGYTISGSTATLSQTTPLTGAGCVVQAFLEHGLASIVAPDACNISADTYKYPSGGPPERKKIITTNLVYPWGAAILRP